MCTLSPTRPCGPRRWLALSIAVLAGCAAAAAADQRPVELSFVPEGTVAGEHPLRLVFEGTVHEPALNLPLDAPGLDGIGGFLQRMFAVSRGEEPAALLAYWHPSERQEMERIIDTTFAQNRSVQRTITRSVLHYELRYGPYLLAAVAHERHSGEPIVSLYPLREVDGRYFMSQGLADDWVYLFLRSVFRARLGDGDEVLTVPARLTPVSGREEARP